MVFACPLYGKVSSTLMRFCVQTHSLNPLSSLHKETIEKLLKSGLLKAQVANLQKFWSRDKICTVTLTTNISKVFSMRRKS